MCSIFTVILLGVTSESGVDGDEANVDGDGEATGTDAAVAAVSNHPSKPSVASLPITANTFCSRSLDSGTAGPRHPTCHIPFRIFGFYRTRSVGPFTFHLFSCAPYLIIPGIDLSTYFSQMLGLLLAVMVLVNFPNKWALFDATASASKLKSSLVKSVVLW